MGCAGGDDTGVWLPGGPFLERERYSSVDRKLGKIEEVFSQFIDYTVKGFEKVLIT